MNTKGIFKALGTIVAVGTLTLSTAAIAQDRGGRMGGNGDPSAMVDKLGAKLNLSADQKTKIKAISDQFQKDNASALSQMKDLRTQMQGYAKSGDKTNMKATGDKMRTQMQTLKPAREKMRNDIMAVLTPDQRTQAQELFKERVQDAKQFRQGRQQGTSVH